MKDKSFAIPVLTTERLTLEPLSPFHSKGMFDLWSDSDVCKYSGAVADYDGNHIEMPATSRADSDLIIDFWLHAAKDNWGFRWAVLESDSKNFTGTIGYNSLGDCSEIAYHLIPKYWGRGIMRGLATSTTA